MKRKQCNLPVTKCKSIHMSITTAVYICLTNAPYYLLEYKIYRITK